MNHQSSNPSPWQLCKPGINELVVWQSGCLRFFDQRIKQQEEHFKLEMQTSVTLENGAPWRTNKYGTWQSKEPNNAADFQHVAHVKWFSNHQNITGACLYWWDPYNTNIILHQSIKNSSGLIKNSMSLDSSIKVLRLQFRAVISILHLKSDTSPVAVFI